MESQHPVDKVAAVLGSQAAIAALLGVTKAAVGQWKGPDRRIPAEHCPTLERETSRLGCPVWCEQMRPDIDWAVLRLKPAPCSAALSASDRSVVRDRVERGSVVVTHAPRTAPSSATHLGPGPDAAPPELADAA